MPRRQRDNSYSYALFGIVLIVLLVAVVLLVKLTGVRLDGGSRNLGGQVIDIGPVGPVQPVTEGTPFPVGQGTATLTSTGPRQATFSLSGSGPAPTTTTLQLGETLTHAGATMTLARVDGKDADVLIATNAEACASPIDGQSALCRGDMACCGGTCQALPTCTGIQDGPAGSCGQRQLYCCGGELSLEACGGSCGNGVCEEGEADVCPPPGQYWPCTLGTCQQDCEKATCGDGVVDDGEQCDDGNEDMYDSCGISCQLCPIVKLPGCPAGQHYEEVGDTNGDGCGNMACVADSTTSCAETKDCPVINCYTEPCTKNLCVDSTCQELYVTPTDGKACTSDVDCPPDPQCFTQPCDLSVCYQGQCVIASAKPPSNNGGLTK